MTRALFAAFAAFALAGCGATASTTTSTTTEAPSGGGRLPKLADAPPMKLTGVRCKDGVCACRELDNFGNPIDTQKETDVPAGKKRFELRVGRSTDDVKISILGVGTFAKPGAGEPEGACAYVDVAPGKHLLRYRIEALRPEQGISPLLMIKEWGAKAESWYDTLAFRCGQSGPCLDADVTAWVKQLRGVERGIHDRCGSVRIQEVRFGGDHAPDHALTALDLEMTLNVYDFAPTRPHGADCSKRSAKEPE